MSDPRRIATVAALAVVTIALCGTPSPGADDAMHDVGSFSGFDHIKTSGGIDYNLTSGSFAIPQRFDASRGGTEISADHADGNSKAKLLHANGSVVVHQNQPLTGHGSVAENNTKKPSTLTCDRLDVDGVRKLYVANGNVHFVQEGGREATSDSATLNDVTNQLHMEGHVHIKDGDQTLDGDVVDYNTVTGQVHAVGAPLLTTVPVPTNAPAPPKAPRAPKKHR